MSSTIILCPQPPASSLLWAINAAGKIFNVTVSGDVTEENLPIGWVAERISASLNGYVWVIASDISRTKYAVWCKRVKETTWSYVIPLQASAEITQSKFGLWILSKDHLTLVDIDGNTRCSHRLVIKASDVCESVDGSLWLIGGKVRHGGWSIQRLPPGNDRWFEFPEPVAAVRVSCAPDGTAWATNSKGQVWRIHPDGPGHFTECGQHASCRKCLKSPATQNIILVSVGADGQVWGLSNKQVTDGNQIIRLIIGTKMIVELPQSIGAVHIAASTMAADL